MPILHAGSEGEMFLWENTLSALGDDDKRRGSVQINGGDQLVREWSGSNDIWVHTRIATLTNNYSFSITTQPFWNVRTSALDYLAYIRGSSSSGQGSAVNATLYLAQTSGGTPTSVFSFTATASAFFNVDLRVQISTTTDTDDTITYTFYVNQVRRFTASYVDASGWSQPEDLFIRPNSNDYRTDDVYVQDVIITDAIPTVGMELITMYPSAVGNYTDFSNDYTAIDESGYDSADAIGSSATAERESWTFTPEPFTIGDKIVYAVVMSNVAQLDITGSVNDFQPFLRISATDYAAANIGANNISADNYISIWTTNPNTSVLWTSSDLSSLEAGVLTV